MRDYFDITIDGFINKRNKGGASGHAARHVYTINRDFHLLNPGVFYFYDTLDTRFCNYKEFYKTDLPIPVFQYHRRAGLNAVIIPLSGYHEYRSTHIPEFSDKTAFHEKASVIFWRGVLSGSIPFRGTLWHTHSIVGLSDLTDDQKLALLRKSLRFNICERSLDSDIIDARIVRPQSDTPMMKGQNFLEHLWESAVPREKHFGYRYLLALDGYDGPSSWYWMLNTNSVVFRQDSDWEMFGDVYFSPWIHYIPIQKDGSDIIEKYEWCERNPAEMVQITQNARAAWKIVFDSDYRNVRQEHLYKTYNIWASQS